VAETVNNRLSSYDVAFVGIFAALSVVIIKTLPGIPIVGVSGASIKFDAAIAPIYGLIIGPYLGFLAALLGGLVTAGSLVDVLTSFSPAMSALIAGFLTQRYLRSKEGAIKGWMAGAAILGAVILGWYLTPVGQEAPFYPLFHLAGLVLILAMRGRTADAFREGKVDGQKWHVKPTYLLAGILIIVAACMLTKLSSSELWVFSVLSLPLFLIGVVTIVYSVFGIGKGSLVLAIIVASFCGIVADHMLGNLAYIGVYGLPASLFVIVLPVSVVERASLTAVATVFGVGLILALKRANLLTRKL
jgi:hypothetical protein